MTVREDVLAYAEKLREQEHEAKNARVRAQAAQNKEDLAKEDLTTPHVFFADGHVWLNWPMVCKVLCLSERDPNGRCATILKQSPVPSGECRSWIATHKVFRADGVRDLIDTGALGEGRKLALVIARADTLDDCYALDGSVGFAGNGLPILGWKGTEVVRVWLQQHYREARLHLATDGDGRLNDKDEPRMGWARGVNSLAEAMPVEVGVRKEGALELLLWVRRLPRAEQTPNAQG